MRVKMLANVIVSAFIAALAASTAVWAGHVDESADCFEAREVYTLVQRKQLEDGGPNVKCSDFTGAALWYGDPYDDTIPLPEMPIEGDYSHEEAVVKPRTKFLKYYMPCTACHNGMTVKVPKDKFPRELKMHKDIVPDSLKILHGKGAMWCLDCHNAVNRNTLIDHRGNEIGFNEPQRLCGKCHGQIYHDWREGIHGKRIGSWVKGGKKRWWVCTECHNPHDVELPFKVISPERAPLLPKNMTSADHERRGEHYKQAIEGQHVPPGGHEDHVDE